MPARRSGVHALEPLSRCAGSPSRVRQLPSCFAEFWLGLHQPLSLVLGVIALSAWLNVFLSFAFPQQRLVSSPEAALQLGFDTVQLSALLALTGGLNTPFLMLIIVPVTVAAVSLRPIWPILLAIIALGLAAMMPCFLHCRCPGSKVSS